MNVLAPRLPQQWEDGIKKIATILHIPDTRLELKGSAGLASQQYFSDYDFFSFVPLSKRKISIFNTIRKKLGDLPVLLIETKVETPTGKTRYFTDEPITSVKDATLIKIDMVAYLNFAFTEVSCIYSFSKDAPTKEEYLQQLTSERKELEQEGNYYKALKRMFSIYKIKGEADKLVALTRYFNSPDGLLYQRLSNYDAVQLVKQHYSGDTLDAQLKSNLKEIGITTPKERTKVYKELNKNAKKMTGRGQMEIYEKLLKNKESYVPKEKGFFEKLLGGEKRMEEMKVEKPSDYGQLRVDPNDSSRNDTYDNRLKNTLKKMYGWTGLV